MKPFEPKSSTNKVSIIVSEMLFRGLWTITINDRINKIPSDAVWDQVYRKIPIQFGIVQDQAHDTIEKELGRYL